MSRALEMPADDPTVVLDPDPTAGAGPLPAPSPSSSADGAAGRMIRNFAAGSVWTVLSRVTGLAETITVGAVLGATYLSNSYQAVNSLPNLVYYQLLAGSLFASILVPPLVAHVDRGDRAGAEALVGGFLGRLLALAALASCAFVAAGPLIVRLLTLAVKDPGIAAAQRHVSLLFLLMFIPQVALYVVAGTWGAVQNAHGRFALAAAAPTFENIGLITTLLLTGALFGAGVDIRHVPGGELLLLGLGTTGAVALHASVQRWGARWTGIRFHPMRGWSDPEVRTVLRRIPPALAYTGLEAVQIVAVLVVANRLAGGLVTFQLALSFFFLPMAIVTWPLARAVLPELARAHLEGTPERFRDGAVRAVRLASFVTLPIAAACLTISVPIARAVTVGHLATGRSVHLVAISLAALGLGIVGESWFILGTYAFYGRQDVRSPLRTMVVRSVAFVGLLVLAWFAPGGTVLVALGGCISLATLVAATHIGLRLRRTLRSGQLPLLAPVARTAAASTLMTAPVALLAYLLRGLAGSELGELAMIAILAVAGLAAYLGIQAAWGAPELSWFRRELAARRNR